MSAGYGLAAMCGASERITHPPRVIQNIEEFQAREDLPISGTIGRGAVALSGPGVMGRPSVAVGAFMAENDHRIIPGRLDDIGGGHHNDADAIGPTAGAAQGYAEVKDHVGTEFADVDLIPGGYCDNRSLGIGAIILLRRQYPKPLSLGRAGKGKQQDDG